MKRNGGGGGYNVTRNSNLTSQPVNHLRYYYGQPQRWVGGKTVHKRSPNGGCKQGEGKEFIGKNASPPFNVNRRLFDFNP